MAALTQNCLCTKFRITFSLQVPVDKATANPSQSRMISVHSPSFYSHEPDP